MDKYQKHWYLKEDLLSFLPIHNYKYYPRGHDIHQRSQLGKWLHAIFKIFILTVFCLNYNSLGVLPQITQKFFPFYIFCYWILTDTCYWETEAPDARLLCTLDTVLGKGHQLWSVPSYGSVNNCKSLHTLVSFSETQSTLCAVSSDHLTLLGMNSEKGEKDLPHSRCSTNMLCLYLYIVPHFTESQVFIEHLLCTSLCFRHWWYQSELNKPSSCPSQSLYSCGREETRKKYFSSEDRAV